MRINNKLAKMDLGPHYHVTISKSGSKQLTKLREERKEPIKMTILPANKSIGGPRIRLIKQSESDPSCDAAIENIEIGEVNQTNQPPQENFSLNCDGSQMNSDGIFIEEMETSLETSSHDLPENFMEVPECTLSIKAEDADEQNFKIPPLKQPNRKPSKMRKKSLLPKNLVQNSDDYLVVNCDSSNYSDALEIATRNTGAVGRTKQTDDKTVSRKSLRRIMVPGVKNNSSILNTSIMLDHEVFGSMQTSEEQLPTVRVASMPTVDTDTLKAILADNKQHDSTLAFTKVDKEDPRSRLHFVKYMKKDGKTVKIWECGICGREFIHQYTLMRHLPTHTDERNFKCDVCGKAFRQMSTLSQHKPIHSKHRPYVCDICKKTFNRVSTLISHKKIHEGVKNHTCPVCGKSFHQKGNLKSHMFIHTNERPFKCYTCGRGFNQASNLQAHRLRSHNETEPLVFESDGSVTPYKCDICSVTCNSKAALKRHQAGAHPGSVQLLPHGLVMGLSRPKEVLPKIGVAGRKGGQKRRRIGSARFIQLPERKVVSFELSQDTKSPNKLDYTIQNKTQLPEDSLLIPAIKTSAFESMRGDNKSLFALFRPSASEPVVVKVQVYTDTEHLLLPATREELKQASQLSASTSETGSKAVHIKIPVVATVVQRVCKVTGKHIYDSYPPSQEIEEPEESQVVTPKRFTLVPNAESSLLAPNTTFFTDSQSVNYSDSGSPMLVMSKGDGQILVNENSNGVLALHMDINNANILSGCVENGVIEEGASAPMSLQTVDQGANGSNMEEDTIIQGTNGLSEIQYLCATGNQGEFEMVSPDDPRITHIINSAGHLQEIQNTTNEVQPSSYVVKLELNDEGSNIMMNAQNIASDEGFTLTENNQEAFQPTLSMEENSSVLINASSSLFNTELGKEEQPNLETILGVLQNAGVVASSSASITVSESGAISITSRDFSGAEGGELLGDRILVQNEHPDEILGTEISQEEVDVIIKSLPDHLVS